LNDEIVKKKLILKGCHRKKHSNKNNGIKFDKTKNP